MADISIQFHALPDELILFAAELAQEDNVFLVIMKFFPFELRPIGSADVEAALGRALEFRRWAFTLGPPDVSVNSELEFADRNASHLRLEAGRLTEKGLEQSWLTARTNDRLALAVWNRVAGRLRRRTNKGVVAVNPKTQATAVMKSFRYTAAAKSLEARGVPILPFAGTSVLRLGTS